MFVKSDRQHDEDSREHSEDLEGEAEPVCLLLFVGGDGMGVAGGELRHHVHQGHVQEDARRGCEHPGGEGVEGTQEEADDHADTGQDRGEDVVEHSLHRIHRVSNRAKLIRK